MIELYSPKPKVKRGISKRKAEAAAHLTGSPYKAMLTNKSQNKTKKPTKKRKKTKCTAPEDSEEEDWPCIICGESFRNSRSREKWIQCVSCKKWAHYECTAQTGCSFVCPNCDSDDDI